MQDRAIFLFDGPNFYKNLKQADLLKWPIDYQKLARKLAGPRVIVDIIYFTSPTDIVTDTINYANQQRFLAAMRNNGITIKLGKLVKRKQICPICGEYFDFKTEKSVDVQLAMEITLGAIEDKWDTVYLATCDSDLLPAIDYARSCGKKIFLMLPTGAKCYSVKQSCDSTINISQSIIQSCQV